MKLYLGIDPGISGAAALIIESNKIVAWTDWPGDEYAAAAWLSNNAWPNNNIVLAAIESATAMPKQGVSSTFKFGVNYGMWRGILAAYKIPCEIPTPKTWQKGLLKKADGENTKARSLAVARRLYPDMIRNLTKSKHGRADALLLAYWARNMHLGLKP